MNGNILYNSSLCSEIKSIYTILMEDDMMLLESYNGNDDRTLVDIT